MCVCKRVCTFACVCVFSPAVYPCVARPLAADKLKRAKQSINSFSLPLSSPPCSSLSQQYHSCQLTPSNASYLSRPETCPPTHPSLYLVLCPFLPLFFLSTLLYSGSLILSVYLLYYCATVSFKMVKLHETNLLTK